MKVAKPFEVSKKHCQVAMQLECNPGQVEEVLKRTGKEEEVKAVLQNLPSFSEGYQAWYSEAKALVRQLLPDRLASIHHMRHGICFL